MDNLQIRFSRILVALLTSTILFLLLLGSTTIHGQAKDDSSATLIVANGTDSFTQQSLLDQSSQDQSSLGNVIAQLAQIEDHFHASKPVISPDRRFAAVTIVPLGTETAFFARTQLYDLAGGQMLKTISGYTPRWLDGGALLQVETVDRNLTFYTISDLLAPETDALSSTVIANQLSASGTIVEKTVAPVNLSSATYPQTIRVAHHPSNGCRNVPDWQVDTIPFEEYVARVVPAETPSWWPIDALAAQAVAARTYAWRKILAGRSDYDVTDWANYQMMCDARHPNSDTAATMTQGQYLTIVDDSSFTPISAMYSAENGHPTLTNPNVTYLQSVPDRFALGRERWGHGYGLSQWGAYRRANAGQSYRQILGHYYSNVYLRDALVPENQIAALFGSEPPYQIATDSILLRAMAPTAVAVHYTISATALLTEPVLINPDLNSREDGNLQIWRADSPLPEATKITASLWISDQVQDTVTWQVDHQPPPAPQLTLPEIITTSVVTLAVPADRGLPLLSAGWQWLGAALSHTANSGAVVNDDMATTGVAWQAEPGVHSAGVWYGPYTDLLPVGHSYRALFWLRVSSSAFSTQTVEHRSIARLDITDDEGRQLLGLRDLYTTDFVDAKGYRPIAVDFHLFDPPQGLEFRVAWAGIVGLALDRVSIWQLPDSLISAERSAQQADQLETTALFAWPVADTVGLTAANQYTRTIRARASDDAGNLSTVVDYALTIVDQHAPIFAARIEPQGWIASHEVTLTAIVSDTGSGLDLSTGTLVVRNDEFTVTQPVQLTRREEAPQSASIEAQLHDLPDGIYSAEFVVYDQAGNRATASYPLRIDSVAPVVDFVGSPPVDQWLLEPLTLTINGSDSGSGIQDIYYSRQALPQGLSETAIYTTPLALATGGVHTFALWATDRAGNRSNPVTTTIHLDLVAPTVQVTQTAINSTTVHVDWQAHDDGSGVATAEWQRRLDDGDWESLPALDLENATGITVPVAPQQQTWVRLRVTDHVGRVGDWTEIALWAPTEQIFLPLINRGSN